MKFHEVLKACNLKVVVENYSETYEIPYIKSYHLIKTVLEELKQTDIDEGYGDSISIMIERDEEANTFEVYGKDAITNEMFGMDFSLWEEWLNSKIDDQVFEQLSVDEIVTYCLYEMTINGRTNDEVKVKVKDLELLIENLSNHASDEMPVNLNDYMSSEELMDLKDGMSIQIQIPGKKKS